MVQTGGSWLSRSLRFGASDGQRYSQYWKSKAAAERPELVLSGNRTGQFFHATMHEDEAYWHLKITLPGGVIERPWQPPRTVAPGVRRLVQVIIPFEAVRYPAPPRSARVTWHPAAPSPDEWVEFTVLHRGPVRPRIANASIMGDVTLADGSIVTVIARHAPAQSGAVPLRVEDPGAVLPLLREPNMGALLHGAFPDGCIWFLHLATTPAGTT